MTYNIEASKDDGWGGRDISKAISTIVNAIPDVVGLQEDDKEWRDSGCYSSLTSAGYTRIAFEGNGDEHLDIFYKTDKFELRLSGYNFYTKLASGDLKDVPANGADMSVDEAGDKEYVIFGDRKGRMFSYAVLEDKATGAVVLVVNTHLHYGDGTGGDTSDGGKYADDNRLRDYQARLLRAWLDSMVEQYPIQIVMGDMNAHPSGAGNLTLEEYTKDSGLKAARDTALLKGDLGGTLTSSSTYNTRDQWVFDHVFYRNATAVEYYVVNNKVDASNTRYPSDHLPVYSKFTCYAE